MDLGVRDLFTGAGGEAEADAEETDRQVYYECRACGRELDDDHDACPGCGGEVAGHLL